MKIFSMVLGIVVTLIAVYLVYDIATDGYQWNSYKIRTILVISVLGLIQLLVVCLPTTDKKRKEKREDNHEDTRD